MTPGSDATADDVPSAECSLAREDDHPGDVDALLGRLAPGRRTPAGSAPVGEGRGLSGFPRRG